jgi:protein SCO1/2
MWRLHGVALLLLAGLLAGCGQPAYQFKGTPYPPDRQALDFTLTSEEGEPFQLSDHKDQVILLFFGYTSCPDVCPTTLAEARQVLNDLEGDADQVAFLFITVDPERDTPERLAKYTDVFHPAITGLTGDAETLAHVRDAYGVVAEKEQLTDSALGYVVNHTARTFLVDQQGNLKLSYRYGTVPEDILSDVKYLLQS